MNETEPRKVIVYLTDEQYTKLSEQARLSKLRFFDYCRSKLVDGINEEAMALVTTSRRHAVSEVSKIAAAKPPKTGQPDRIERLEAMMMQMADAIQNLANPQHIVEAEPAADVDLDAVVNQSLEAADRYGVAVEREQAPVSPGGIRPVGQRMVSRLAVGQVPSHVAGLFPSS